MENVIGGGAEQQGEAMAAMAADHDQVATLFLGQTVDFLPGLAVGTALFVAAHILLGYFLGPAIMEYLESIEIPIWAILLVVAVIGLVGWLAIRAKNRRARTEGLGASLAEWADACCPACLAAGRIVRDRVR